MTPVLTVVAGPNGSGKSSFVRAMRWNSVDPDRIAADYGEGFSDAANLRAAREALGLMAEALERRQNLVLETTLAARQPLRVMTSARAAGYVVHLVLIVANGDDDTRLRIDNRVLAGGHNIPDADLERRLPRILANLPDAMSLADLTAIYVSSVRSGDFTLEGAQVGGRVQLTANVPVPLRTAMGTRFKVHEVEEVRLVLPVAEVFRMRVIQE